MTNREKIMERVDPEIKALVEGPGAADYGDDYRSDNFLTPEGLVETRTLARSLYVVDNVTEKYDVDIDEIKIPNAYDGATLRALLVKPKKDSGRKHPLIYSVHQGGMIVGVPEECSPLNARLAQDHDFIGVSVEYRLAPEYKQPTQLQDLYSGLKWCVDHAGELNIDTDRIVVTGISAGAGLAGGLALYVRDQGEFSIGHLQLIFPMLDNMTPIREAHPYNGLVGWSMRHDYVGWKAILGPGFDTEEVSPYYSPARAESLEGLPSTFLAAGSIELFADETLDFAKRLMRDNVSVELHLLPDYHHAGITVTKAYHAKQTIDASVAAMLRALKVR